MLEIRPAVSEISFASDNKVLLSFETFHKIVYNKRHTKNGKKSHLLWPRCILLRIPKRASTMLAPPAESEAVSGAGGANMPEQSTAAINVSRRLSPPMLTIATILSIPFWRCSPSKGIDTKCWSMNSCKRKNCGRFNLDQMITECFLGGQAYEFG